jgi:hypothetical protein
LLALRVRYFERQFGILEDRSYKTIHTLPYDPVTMLLDIYLD